MSERKKELILFTLGLFCIAQAVYNVCWLGVVPMNMLFMGAKMYVKRAGS